MLVPGGLKMNRPISRKSTGEECSFRFPKNIHSEDEDAQMIATDFR